VYRVLDKLGCPKQFTYRPISGRAPRAWQIPIQVVADVCAMAEHLGGRAVVDRQVALL
jgi:hypothetical protein